MWRGGCVPGGEEERRLKGEMKGTSQKENSNGTKIR